MLAHSLFNLFARRGRFTLVRNVKQTSAAGGMTSAAAGLVAKISLHKASREEESLREYNILKAMKQQNIVRMHEAYLHNEVNV